jgi:putative oxidoreductase
MDEARNNAWSRQWALLPLRLVVGYGFMAHGVAKWSRGPDNFGKLLQQVGVPLPTATAWIVTLLEVFGGLAILAGVLVTLASVPLIVSMLVAMFTVQLHYGFSSVNTIGLTATGPVFGPPGYEINLLYIASLLTLALLGPGTLSAERWLASFFEGALKDKEGKWIANRDRHSSQLRLGKGGRDG